MRTLLLMLGLLVALGAQSQEIYKWVDKDGVVHYADQPGAPDASRVTIVSTEPPPQDEAGNATSFSRMEEVGPSDRNGYTAISIASPSNDQVFYGANVAVPVNAAISPFLRTGHEVAFYIDGGRTDQVRGTSGQITGLSRGTHTLQVRVFNGGEEMIASDPVTFHVRAPSIARPPTGPTVNLPRPIPPRPQPRPPSGG